MAIDCCEFSSFWRTLFILVLVQDLFEIPQKKTPKHQIPKRPLITSKTSMVKSRFWLVKSRKKNLVANRVCVCD